MFRPTDALHLYGSYGRGFETPTIAEVAYRADGASGLALNLQPATSRNAELGAKWRRGKLHAQLAVFDIRSDDEAFVMEAVRRVLDGDVEAFAVVVNAHQRLIAADLARRLPAQDVQEVAQDAFIRAFRSLPSYRREAPFRIWILRIARHAAMDFWRKKYRRRDLLFSDFGSASDTRSMTIAFRTCRDIFWWERRDSNPHGLAPERF